MTKSVFAFILMDSEGPAHLHKTDDESNTNIQMLKHLLEKNTLLCFGFSSLLK